MTKPAPVYPTSAEYPTLPEVLKRALSMPPVPELARTAPTARLERGFFATVADVTNALGEAHALAQMTRADLARLVRLGELAQERLAERD